MICANCGKDNAQRYTRKTEGREVTVLLCPSCYEALYPKQTNDFFTSFVRKVGGRARACPACGATQAGFRRTGLVGCAYCYTAFREELMPTIRYVQGKTRHEGKTPSEGAEEKYDFVRGLVNEQDTLRERLRRAEDEHDEARAEALRRELGEIDRMLSGGEGTR